MAKITLTGLMADIQGSIGGTTFQRSRAGLIARRKPIPKTSRTAKQSAIIAEHQTLNAQFILLPLSTKLQWDSFALAHTRTDKYGNVNTLTGLNWYQSINFTLFLISEPLKTLPPSYIIPFAPIEYTGCLENNELKITNPFPLITADHSILIYTTPPLTRSTISDWSNFRLTKTLNTSPSNIIDLTADWESTHSRTLNTSQFSSGTIIGIAIQSARKSTGLKSNFVYLLQNVNQCNLMLKYIAQITQSGTAAPTVEILENTIGNIVWSRNSAGIYKGTLTGIFTANKTWSLITFNTLAAVTLDVLFIIWRDNINEVFIETADVGVLADDILKDTSLEIRVYQ